MDVVIFVNSIIRFVEIKLSIVAFIIRAAWNYPFKWMMYEKEFGPLVAGIDISGDPRQQDITLLLPKLIKLRGTLRDFN